MTLVEISDLLGVLRAHGVRRFKGDVEVEFEPEVDSTPEAAPTEEPRCACGHQAHEHGHGGLCLLGCEPDVCAPDKEENPK